MIPATLTYHPGWNGRRLGAADPRMPPGYDPLAARLCQHFAWAESTARTRDPIAFARTAALLTFAIDRLTVQPADTVDIMSAPHLTLVSHDGRHHWPSTAAETAARRIAHLDDLHHLRRPGRNPEDIGRTFSAFRAIVIDGRVLAGAPRIPTRTPLHTNPINGRFDTAFEDRPGDGDPRPDPDLAARYARAASKIHDKLTKRVPDADVLRIDLALDADGEVVLEDVGPVDFLDLYAAPPRAVLTALLTAARTAPGRHEKNTKA